MWSTWQAQGGGRHSRGVGCLVAIWSDTLVKRLGSKRGDRRFLPWNSAARLGGAAPAHEAEGADRGAALTEGERGVLRGQENGAVGEKGEGEDRDGPEGGCGTVQGCQE